MTLGPVLSHVQAAPLLEARRKGQATAQTSTDLALTTVAATFGADGITLPGGDTVAWADLEHIAATPGKCFLREDGEWHEIKNFSDETNRAYSLFPTRSAPTLLVSGINMHRIKDSDPHQDTLQKIKAAAPISGRVLDTTTGLGYTAIQAARTATEVITVEVDPAASEIARLNPWSQDLFTNPKITRLINDSAEQIEEFPAARFARIIHDPPVMSLGGDLYSLAFYQQMYRVLESGGRAFHYIGDPTSKSGASITRGVIRRLYEAGFRRVTPAPAAFGVVAYK